MAQKRRTPPKRSQRPTQPRAPKGGGSRVSVSGSVSPKFTLFGGSLFSFTFGGRGKGSRRGGGGLFKRIAGLARRAAGELSGKSTGGAGPSPAGGSGRSFDDFRNSRPDLFGGGHPDDVEATAIDNVIDVEVIDDDVPPAPDRSRWATRAVDPPGGAR